MATLAEIAAKPLDASDITTVEQARAEIIAMRDVFTRGEKTLWPVVKLQNSKTSALVIKELSTEASFAGVAAKATEGVLARDKEDAAKLDQGITLAVNKGVIPKDVTVEETLKIDVIGKTADQVAGSIVKALGKAPESGCVVVLQGLSGTGKGTTVKKLSELLPKATTWSNGNIFRSLTLLAATYCEQNKCDLKDALTPECLASFVGMLTFDKYKGKFDVQIKGLGLELLVSEVQNTTLKGPKVRKNIPTVAGVTQGEVIGFVANATKTMAADGFNVLVEGREQTLNHLRTPHRFELTLSDMQVIGRRRAAQRIGALVFDALKGGDVPDDPTVRTELRKELAKIAAESD